MNENVFLYGKPNVSAKIKSSPEDFIVNEDLGFLPDGEGEHVLIRLQKRACNTQFVADKLAQFAGIAKRAVSYAGLKDKHAVTTQWFCLHIPGKTMPDFATFDLEGCQIQTVSRHKRKLRIGTLQGNTFVLTLREVSDTDALFSRWQTVVKHGVANYFGAQRFGIEGNNIQQALAWANNEIKIQDRNKRSFYLSAARSMIFNHIVSQRIEQHYFNHIMAGDILQLTERGSWFVGQDNELEQLQQRLEAQEIQITAPLVGVGQLDTEQQAQQFELQCLTAPDVEKLLALIQREGVNQARRAIRLLPRETDFQLLDPQTVKLHFWLPTGCFATALLRELVIENQQFIEMSE